MILGLDNLNQDGPIAARRSMSDQVYEILTEMILRGEIGGGERLVEREVAARLQTSRTPVREAFRRLEQDQLVRRVPQGGVRVTEVNARIIREVFGIRAVLEAYAGELACREITTEELTELKRINHQAGDALNRYEDDPDKDVRELYNLNSLFHVTLAKAAKNEHLIHLTRNYRSQELRFRFMSIQDYTNRHQAWQDHERIIRHLEQGDSEGIWKLIREHIESGCEAALKKLAEA